MKSPRNKTLSLTEREREQYTQQLVFPQDSYDWSQILDKVIFGDSFEELKKLPKNFIDLLIIDPPYNLSKKYNERNFNQRSEQDYITYLEEWFPLLLPALKENASVYICCDWKSSQAIYQILSKYLIIQNRITWQREKGRGALHNWKNGMEDIWFATCSKDYYFNVEAVKMKRKVIAPYRENGKPKDWEDSEDGKYRLTYPSNFWDDISIPYWSMPENTEHPTQKPEKLIAKLILASSKEGDIVFDPFLGSGTTAVTAKKLKRHFSGIERELEYCLFAQKRLHMCEENPNIQGYDGVFWERNSQIKKI